MISRYILIDHDTDQMHHAQDIRVREEGNEAYVTAAVVDIDRRVDVEIVVDEVVDVVHEETK